MTDDLEDGLDRSGDAAVVTAKRGTNRPRKDATDAVKAENMAKAGDVVHYWNAHATRDIGPAEKPCHAIVANVLEDKQDGGELLVRCTLAVLTHVGTWRSMPAVKFSETPKTNCWTWPK